MATQEPIDQLRQNFADFLGVPLSRLDEALKETQLEISKPEVGTYHDVEVGCNNYVYRMFNVPFCVQLQCSRMGGWELWDVTANDAKGERLGGEYENEPFEIRLHDQIVCNNRFIVPTLVNSKELRDDQTFRLGRIRCETVWNSWENILTVYLPHPFNQTQEQLDSLYESLGKYMLRFGGVSWAGYFWKVLQSQKIPSPDRAGFDLQLADPKTDG